MQFAGSDLAIFLGYARIIASVLRSSNSLQKTLLSGVTSLTHLVFRAVSAAERALCEGQSLDPRAMTRLI